MGDGERVESSREERGARKDERAGNEIEPSAAVGDRQACRYGAELEKGGELDAFEVFRRWLLGVRRDHQHHERDDAGKCGKGIEQAHRRS
jgi:hypothetical protein